MKLRLLSISAAAFTNAALLSGCSSGVLTPVHAAGPTGVANILLVHGAWSDGSSWSKVIPLLQADGYNVVAVQLPLTSLADDTAVECGPMLLPINAESGSTWSRCGRSLEAESSVLT